MKLRRSWTLMRGHRLCMLQGAAVRKICGDACCPKAVIADRREDTGGDGALAHHAPCVCLGHWRVGKRDAFVAAAGTE